MNCDVNIDGGVLLAFYIFMGKRLFDNYIKNCKPRSYMAM